MEIKIRTGRARRTHRRPIIVGYRWKWDQEYEILACGHERPVESSWIWACLDAEDELISELAESPTRRSCEKCPTPRGWAR